MPYPLPYTLHLNSHIGKLVNLHDSLYLASQLIYMRHSLLLIVSAFIFSVTTFQNNKNLTFRNHTFGQEFIDTTKELGKKVFLTSCANCHKD